MSRIEEAVAYFAEGFSCAQSVCAAYAPLYGMEREMALRAAGAFGGGMGRSGQICGAVTGAIIVIGLKYGKTQAEDNATRETCYALAAEFIRRFEERHGALTCPGLLGCHIGTPEGRALAHEKGLYASICANLVRDAAEILEAVLEIKEG
ncbi:MAG: C-GCAxxG-C-C family protein [Anaerolineae bacterium]|jgi:C_GCAxxG_C_C family probable redox protein